MRPRLLVALRKTIDEVAGTKRWIEGTAEGVQNLRQEGFDFSAPEAVAGLANMMRYGTAEGAFAYLAAGVQIADNDGVRSVLAAAVSRDDREIAAYLLQSGIDKANSNALNSLLHQAARCGDKPLVDLLIRTGADVNSIDKGGRTLLMDAAYSTDLDLIEAVLQRHAVINSVNDQGRTALFDPISSDGCGVADGTKRFPDAVPAIRLLVAAGADVNHQDNDGLTPLHYAGNPSLSFVFEASGVFDVAGPAPLRALIELGAKLNVRDKNGDTPLLSTVFPGAALALIKAGADVTVRNHHGESILGSARSLAAGTHNEFTNDWQRVIAAVQQREGQLAEAQTGYSMDEQPAH